MAKGLAGHTKRLLKETLAPVARKYAASKGALPAHLWNLSVNADGHLSLEGGDLPGLRKE